MKPFRIIPPKGPEVPVIVSSPHSGTEFPEEIRSALVPERAGHPDDTDWFIDRLYDFVPDMGITLMSAVYNRWVVDLNRDPEGQPLYGDGRIITGIVPSTTFNGDLIYRNNEPDNSEIQRRLQLYFYPYHQALQQLVQEKLHRFGKVLLFDAHSIRKQVPGISKSPFPDLILGDNDGKTASPEIIETAWSALENPKFSRSHNQPFRGGYITRHFGHPSNKIHALQLEMAKTNYMDDSETKFSEERAAVLRPVLKRMFEGLIKLIK